MKTVAVENNGVKYNVVLPTSIKEINHDWLNEITNHIMIAADYSLVMLVYSTSLFKIVNDSKKKDNITASVTPVLVKMHCSSKNDYMLDVKQFSILSISGSDLSLGLHVNVPGNDLSLGLISSLLINDNHVVRNALTDKDVVKLIEFKIIPNCNIKGWVQCDAARDDQHIIKVED